MNSEHEELGVALMNLTEMLQSVAAQCSGYRDSLSRTYGYTDQAAEAMSMHLHMRLIEMVIPSTSRRTH